MCHRLIFGSHIQPRPHHIIHHHIEQGWWDEPSVHRPPGCLKFRAMVTILSFDDLVVGSEGYKEISHIWHRTVAFQCPYDVSPVYYVVELSQVEED